MAAHPTHSTSNAPKKTIDKTQSNQSIGSSMGCCGTGFGGREPASKAMSSHISLKVILPTTLHLSSKRVHELDKLKGEAPMSGGQTDAEGRHISWHSAVMLAFALMTVTSCNVDVATEQTQAETPTPATNEIVGIASVIDGDTIEIHGERIRLSGFDTPERGARCGDIDVYQTASLALADFIANRTVACAPGGTDRYNRVTATCSVNGADLGDYIVSQGWGRDWPRYSNGAYADEERAARSAQRGLWGLQCPADLWGDRNYSR